MTTSQEAGWWPKSKTPFAEIIARILKIYEQNSSYFKNPMLSFPGTPWHPIVAQVIQAIGPEHANNIGMHTGPGCSEQGFTGAQELERNVIYWLAKVLGSPNPVSLIDGFFVPGGTAGNQQGIWMARNHILQADPQARIIVITSCLGHNSIAKAANLCGLTPEMSRGHHIFQTVRVDANGAMRLNELEALIKKNKNNYSFIIIPTLGTTLTGAADDLKKIWQMCHQYLSRERYWIHCDAAFGGLVYPFLYPKRYLQWVDSMIVDFHKMGFAPYGAGIFMCRKETVEQTTAVTVEYINGIHDGTINGSRSGVIPAACWAIIQALGKQGFKEITERCFALTKDLRNKMIELEKVAGATEPVINQFAIWLKPGVVIPDEISQKFHLATMTRDGRTYIKFPVMPHAREELYELLIKWLDE